MKSREPERLKRGKAFHKEVQQEWLETTKHGVPRPERSIRKLNGRLGRMDILVEELGDLLSIVEIKATDWDVMAEKNVRRNVKRQCRQIWGYVDAVMERYGKDVCPGVIFPSLPKNKVRLNAIEILFNDEGIQVVWQNESVEQLKVRMTSQE